MILCLRASVFGRMWGLQIDEYGRESDAYDIDGVTRYVGLAEGGRVVAAFRINPTRRAFMLADLWSEHVFEQYRAEWLVRQRWTWDISRFCVDPALRGGQGEAALQLMATGLHVGSSLGIIRYIVGMAFVRLVAMMQRAGLPVTAIGPAVNFEDEPRRSQAFMMPVTRAALLNLRCSNRAAFLDFDERC